MALQFTPPKSFIEPSFWEEVYNRKLNEWKLSQQSVAITARYGLSDGDIPGALRFNKESFSGGTDGLQVNGVLILVNTIEVRPCPACPRPFVLVPCPPSPSADNPCAQEFKDYDKLASIQADGLRQLDTLLTSSTLTYPSTGSQFTLLAFGDLKQYRFTYWMNNPACVPKLPLVHSMESKQSPSALSAVYGHLLSNAPSSWSMVFVLKDGICMSLSSQPADAQDLVLVVLDQGTGPAMGWSARNLLLTIAHWLHVHGHDEGHVEMIFVRNAVFRNWSGNALMDSVEALGKPIPVMCPLSLLGCPCCCPHCLHYILAYFLPFFAFPALCSSSLTHCTPPPSPHPSAQLPRTAVSSPDSHSPACTPSSPLFTHLYRLFKCLVGSQMNVVKQVHALQTLPHAIPPNLSHRPLISTSA